MAEQHVWQLLPSQAYDIGVGANGAAWMIGHTYGTHPHDGDFYLWNGSGWTLREGEAKRVAVGPDGTAYAVNSLGFAFKSQGGGWVQLPSQAAVIGNANAPINLSHTPQAPPTTFLKFVDIAVGGGGRIWATAALDFASSAEFTVCSLGEDLLGGLHWSMDSGIGERIAVGPDGTVWTTSRARKIFRRDPHSGAWQQMPGAALDLGVGGDGSVWMIGADNGNDGNGPVSRFDGTNWVLIDGRAKNITVGPDGLPWAAEAGDAFGGPIVRLVNYVPPPPTTTTTQPPTQPPTNPIHRGTLTLSFAQGGVGSNSREILIGGSGFAPNEKVDVSVTDAVGLNDQLVATADGAGRISTNDVVYFPVAGRTYVFTVAAVGPISRTVANGTISGAIL